MKKLLVFLLPLVMLAACQPKGEKVPAIDLTDMDLTVSPGDDFYQYANGGWIAKNPLKPEYASFGSFDVLRENNVTRLNDLFAEMSEMSPKAGTVDQKIVDLYKQGLDSVRLNAEGGQPLQKYLDQLYAVSDKAGLAAELADENTAWESRPTSWTARCRYSTSDRADSEWVTATTTWTPPTLTSSRATPTC